jgi:uncharacterized Tic20 family protein
MTDVAGNTSAAEARKWATICHVSALSGFLGNGIGFILGPLIVWILKRDVDPFIDDQGKEALNFQITMFIAAIISAVLTLVVIGLLFLIVVGLLMLIMPIIAAVKSSNGELYRYPLTIRFVK